MKPPSPHHVLMFDRNGNQTWVYMPPQRVPGWFYAMAATVTAAVLVLLAGMVKMFVGLF